MLIGGDCCAKTVWLLLSSNHAWMGDTCVYIYVKVRMKALIDVLVLKTKGVSADSPQFLQNTS